jgi:hypothetical protein
MQLRSKLNACRNIRPMVLTSLPQCSCAETKKHHGEWKQLIRTGWKSLKGKKKRTELKQTKSYAHRASQITRILGC